MSRWTGSQPDHPTFDAVIIGGGPAGSTMGTLLARKGLKVAIFEQEQFPRFHVGESLLPANIPIFDRLGCHDAVRQAGFITKPGATLYDEYEGRPCTSFAFPHLPFQPASAYNVVRAEFDDLLLRHAEKAGTAVYREHAVKHTRREPDKVAIQVQAPDGHLHEVQASLLIDASGRAAFAAKDIGKREPLPALGKVAIFAHFRAMKRERDIPEGNIRLYLVPQGWLWRIPFANRVDSVGGVLHAQVVKARSGSIEALFEEILTASPHLTDALAGAQRITPVHTAANFSYRVSPFVADRYVGIGDASGFIDPVFSTGVFLAMRSAELAASDILRAFAAQDFSTRRFRRYARRLRWGTAAFLPFIQRFYEPAFLDLLFTPAPPWQLDKPVLWVLSGAAFDHRPLWFRLGLNLFFGIMHMRRAARRFSGQPTASRRSW
jgi:flavin-dependent dehydrogenase